MGKYWLFQKEKGLKGSELLDPRLVNTVSEPKAPRAFVLDLWTLVPICLGLCYLNQWSDKFCSRKVISRLSYSHVPHEMVVTTLRSNSTNPS